ncbi:MAG: hypothetical protein AAF611_22410 [Bacteroidota bacterium]
MDSKSKQKSAEKKLGDYLPENAVPLPIAARWTQNWRKRKKLQEINGYLIPMVDITEVRHELGIDNMRGYLAIDDSGINHLLIVGVDEDGNDMINEEEGQFVYDYTLPCPQQCGDGNVLNGGK